MIKKRSKNNVANKIKIITIIFYLIIVNNLNNILFSRYYIYIILKLIKKLKFY